MKQVASSSNFVSYRTALIEFLGGHCSNPKCKSTKKLQIHHIDGNERNNHPSNLLPLCASCHRKVTHNNFVVSTYIHSNYVHHKIREIKQEWQKEPIMVRPILLRCENKVKGKPCGYIWQYNGKCRYYATCPYCLRKVRIQKIGSQISDNPLP